MNSEEANNRPIEFLTDFVNIAPDNPIEVSEYLNEYATVPVGRSGEHRRLSEQIDRLLEQHMRCGGSAQPSEVVMPMEIEQELNRIGLTTEGLCISGLRLVWGTPAWKLR